jgi:hypothetical protein
MPPNRQPSAPSPVLHHSALTERSQSLRAACVHVEAATCQTKPCVVYVVKSDADHQELSHTWLTIRRCWREHQAWYTDHQKTCVTFVEYGPSGALRSKVLTQVMAGSAHGTDFSPRRSTGLLYLWLFQASYLTRGAKQKMKVTRFHPISGHRWTA